MKKRQHYYFCKIQSKFAFTLAEVLITLGIIGVVSAMTIPTLINNYQKQSYVTQLHKVYNEMSQALLQYQTEKNAVNFKEAGLNSGDAVTEFMKSHFKVVNDCGNTQIPCFATEYRKINGTVSRFNEAGGHFLSIASGASFRIAGGNGAVLFAFTVDINGQKGPNILGRDLFELYVYNNGVIDDLELANPNNPDNPEDGTWSTSSVAPLTRESRELNFTKSCNSNISHFWHGCFGKILNDNWQMKY